MPPPASVAPYVSSISDEIALRSRTAATPRLRPPLALPVMLGEAPGEVALALVWQWVVLVRPSVVDLVGFAQQGC